MECVPICTLWEWTYLQIRIYRSWASAFSRLFNWPSRTSSISITRIILFLPFCFAQFLQISSCRFTILCSTLKAELFLGTSRIWDCCFERRTVLQRISIRWYFFLLLRCRLLLMDNALAYTISAIHVLWHQRTVESVETCHQSWRQVGFNSVAVSSKRFYSFALGALRIASTPPRMQYTIPVQI